ncbi:CocE/NonD family hydrolase [Galbibacter pacificus]|uniref:CocE/NonD family hydrolase n=1 Tax=Galbibacter pacificus TaxID=2996052 RepID=A0ABT6FRT7_9FLAO|nr:CocE/NonD family hydrolase [Galbibacter pacificus]MDG3582926.1 CocE/NonD family hydrolase [Galbibacter pacificus]MDG3585955.1 CocE/NonD family hydrolase [Galbibacter pacificus]
MKKRIMISFIVPITIFCFLIYYNQKDSIQSPYTVIENNTTYLIQDSILIQTREGAKIHAMVVRDSTMTMPGPALLFHTIYSRKSDLQKAKIAVEHGYVGVISYTRGKGLSQDSIIPFKKEATDTYDVIEWISKQEWSNQKVGMYGGSYLGFAQWASVKHKVHPALKTIVPSVSVAPGIAEPMENGVYQNFHFPWHHYVSNDRYLDTMLYSNAKRWQSLNMKWYMEGVAYNKMDSLDGLPNPQFKERLLHPTYDSYWQGMMPYKEEFSHIDIPILATTGYYDGGQTGTRYYLNEHTTYNKDAAHYLVIGPYTHFGAQGKPKAHILGYDIDPVAQIDITNLIFEWFDYVLKGMEKPPLLKDKINYEVMGANKWEHVPSLEQMANDTLTYYLSNRRSGVGFRSTYDSGNNGENIHFTLDERLSNPDGYLEQTIDFSDRRNFTWNSSGWGSIIAEHLTIGQGFSFVTEPFPSDFELNGSFGGEMSVSINKKDFDYSVALYEQTPDGKFFALTLPYVGRASYVLNREQRQLLKPNVKTTIPFGIVRMTSKKISKGSRLVVVINGIKEPFTEINYGSGKPVSEESISDGKNPLVITWYSSSHIKIPVKK